MNNDKYLTVIALTKYLKHKFDVDEHLRKILLKGEVSNLKKHSTGHYYFSLKDEYSKINAIMFSTQTKKLKFDVEDGMKVLVSGRVSVYENTGSYQIYVDGMEEDGIGNLYVAFEKLKKKLMQEGLFDEKHKKKIPKIPTKIGIITAPTGAAIKDILSTIQRRFPICETLLFPSLVQGEMASLDIEKNIKRAQNYDLDVLIVGRGGGSIEDLWPFNEENVARAIYQSKIPIISAVGHEVDFTIADFVADLRAPTPTGAAEMAVPSMRDLEKQLKQFVIRANESISKKIKYNQLLFDSITNNYILKNPNLMYENKKQYVDSLVEKLHIGISHLMEIKNQQMKNIRNHYLLKSPEKFYEKEMIKIRGLIEKLEIINPLHVLKRGYTLTYQDGKVVKSVDDIDKNNTIKIKMSDGQIEAKVIDIGENVNE